VDGLWSRLRDPGFLTVLEGHDLVFFSETHLAPSDPCPQIPGFIPLASSSKDRLFNFGKYPGGLSVYRAVNTSYVFTPVYNIGSDSVIWIKFTFCDKPIHIGFVYNHPLGSMYSDPSFYDHLQNDITTLLQDPRSESIILLGDFNSRVGSMSECSSHVSDNNVVSTIPLENFQFIARNSRDMKCNAAGLKLLSFCRESGLFILNGRSSSDSEGHYTYISSRGSSVIDYALLSDAMFFDLEWDFSIVPCDLTEHLPIALTFMTNQPPQQNSSSVGTIPMKSPLKIKGNGKDLAINADILKRFSLAFPVFKESCNSYLKQENTQFVAAEFAQFLHLLIRPFCIRKKPHRNEPAYFNAKCRQLKQETRACLLGFRKTNAPRFAKALSFKRRIYRHARVEAKRTQMSKLRNDLENAIYSKDQNFIWKTVRSFSSGILASPRNSPISPNRWVDHFNKVYNQNTLSRPEWEVDVDQLPDVPELDAEIRMEEVLQSIAKLKSGKSPSKDGITGSALKVLGQSYDFVEFLTTLFNSVLKSGNFPQEWTSAIIFTLYKGSGPRSDPDKYRGIALLSHIGKLFARILAERMRVWAESHSKINPLQAGFRTQRSSIGQALILDTLIKERLHLKRRKLYVCFVDFRKAFDFVSRKALLFELAICGISKRIYKLLHSMFGDSSYSVKVSDEVLTTPTSSSSGVFQGCTWSPLLFILFIDRVFDVLDSVESNSPTFRDAIIRALMFADDLTLISTTVLGLQRQLNALECLCDYWGLKLNIDKTAVLVCKRGGNLASNEHWTFKNCPLKTVRSATYLGILFSCNGHWNQHICYATDKAMKASSSLIRFFYRYKDFSAPFFWRLFKTSIEPVLLYGSEIWGVYPSSNTRLERPGLRFLKTILGLPQGAPSSAVRLEMATIKFREKALYRALSYWGRLTKLPPNHPDHQCLVYQYELVERGVQCWAYYIKDYLFRLGY
jgi:hypothetical protein